ncbi:MAG TPA: hypothetical protein VEU33_15855, partial [Archangium sp.]|nr:hypothetical protein [Archangium sp.]
MGTSDVSGPARGPPSKAGASTIALDRDGHVNLSPKGLDCFSILDPLRVAYLDLTGSGNETSAHLAENGRNTHTGTDAEPGPATAAG